MSQGDVPAFSDKEEEINYWRNLAAQYLEDVERIQKESDEFITESQQLEREYEATIEQNEKKIKELTLANNRAFNDVESMRIKLEQSNKQYSTLQSELDSLNKEKTETARYVRELEQKNDDLERSRRIIEESVDGIERAFNNAIERNAILESEVDEKESLKEKLQRLADETRDLKQELLVKEKTSTDSSDKPVNGFRRSSIVDSNRLKEMETQTTSIKKDSIPFQGSLTPASRVMALNLVSDLLRKCGLSRFLCPDCGRHRCSNANCTPSASNLGIRTPLGPK